MEAGEVGRLRVLEEPPGLDGPSAAARDQRGEVARVVLVAVAETGSVDDQAVVEQRPTVGLLDPVSRGTSRTRGLVVPKRRPQEQRGLVTHRRHQRG